MSPLGKILRISPLQDGRWKYGVPPGKAGKYFFGDIASGRVFFTNVDQLAKATPFFELPLIYSGKQQSLREISTRIAPISDSARMSSEKSTC